MKMNKENSKKLFLVLDIGTSDLKCASVTDEGQIVARDQRPFPMVQQGPAFEVDFERFFDTANALLKTCLAQKTVWQAGVQALLITSQAQTFAPVDADFRPLRPGIVWLDERAGEEAEFLRQRLPEFSAMAGFARPLPSLYVSKLLWLKRHESAVFQEARAFPLIHEFLAQRLTRRFYSDSTNFGMGGLYDFRSGTLNAAILSILERTEESFPDVGPAASRGEMIRKSIQKEWNWPEPFPVFLCGNDQGASASGAGLTRAGDMTINFGTAQVFYAITDALVTELSESQIAGKHPVGEYYFLLSFEPDFGLRMRQLKEAFFLQDSYDDLFQTYFQYGQTPADRSLFEKPWWQRLSGSEARRACAGVIRFYIERFGAHMSQIQEAVPVRNIFVSGGLSRSEVFLKILRNVLGRSFSVANRADAGLIGAVKIYKGVEGRFLF